MTSSGYTFCTIFWNNSSNGFFRIFNSNEYKSEKLKDNSNHSNLFYMILIFIAIFVNSVPYISFGNAILTLFILDITISDFQYLLGYIKKISNYILIGIQITGFFEISKKLSFLSIFSILFSKKELENTKYINKTTRQMAFTNQIITISSIIIVLLLYFNIAYFESVYKRKQQFSLFKEVDKFVKNPKNYPIVPLLWLNDNEIILSFSLGCEKESVSAGRSYFEADIDISHCFFSRSLEFSGAGGVIYVSASSYSMNVNFSMFYNCFCSSDGGAIYYKSSNSYLRMICANSCSASWFHFV